MANIYDVARQAGVSIATVSRVLNGSQLVRPRTRERVLAVARSLDYHPNGLARGLVMKQTGLIALIVPDISNPFFPEVARGVEDAASAAGYSVILCNSDGEESKQETYLAVLRQRRVDGIILAATSWQVGTDREGSGTDETTGRTRANSGSGVRRSDAIPTVAVDRDSSAAGDAVLVNNSAGAAQAARYLLQLGHRRIGIISGPNDTRPGRERLEGFRQVLEDEGCFEPDLVVDGDFRRRSGAEGARRLLLDRNNGERPTAVFAANDLMALGVLDTCEELGFAVPEDVSVVGFDDISLASIVRPKLTTVAQPKYEMGRLAVELLLARLGNGETPMAARRVVLETELVVRASTAAPRRKGKWQQAGSP